MHETYFPIVLAIISAFFFGAQVISSNKSLAFVEPQTSSMISIGTCFLVFWLMAPFLLEAKYFSNPAMWIFFFNGLIHPIFSLYLASEATKRMGPTVSATVSSTAPLFATAGAVLILGEQASLIFLIGTIAIVVGIMVLSWKNSAQFNWAPWALVFPIGAAVIRGFIHLNGKIGLDQIPSPYFAGLVSFSVSFIGSVLIYRFRTGTLPLRLPRQSLMWSGLAGIFITFGILGMYAALHTGRVVVVSPIFSTFPLFTFLISLMFRQEKFHVRILIGVALVIGGVIWISSR